MRAVAVPLLFIVLALDRPTPAVAPFFIPFLIKMKIKLALKAACESPRFSLCVS